MADVKLPLVGSVSRKALAIGGVSAAAAVGLFLLRKRNSSPAAAAPAAGGDGTTGNPADPNSIDPATGLTYGEEAAGTSDYVDPGLQDTTLGPTYGQTGYYDPNTGQWIYGNTGTGQAAAVTNAQWAQDAIAYLGSNVSVDSAALSSALGAYLAGQPLTSDQVSLVDQAIAAEGYPPVSGSGGYPPGIRESGTASQGGTGGSGGGVTGSGGSGGGGSPGGGAGSGSAGGPGGTVPAQVSGLHVTSVTSTAIGLAWNKAARATSYQVRVTYQSAVVQTHMTNSTSYTVGGLTSGRTYGLHVVAVSGSSWAPEASISQKTK